MLRRLEKGLNNAKAKQPTNPAHAQASTSPTHFGQDDASGGSSLINNASHSGHQSDEDMDEDEDDRRSIMTSISSPFAAHQFGTESRSLNLPGLPQSPFAASHLFGRTDEPFSLFSIAETKRTRSRSQDSGFGSRPMTPLDGLGTARFFRENPVPFRRAQTEEDKDPITMADPFQHNSPTGAGSKTPIEFPVMVPVTVEGGTSTVQFPLSSPDQPLTLESPGVF